MHVYYVMIIFPIINFTLSQTMHKALKKHSLIFQFYPLSLFHEIINFILQAPL